MKRILLSSVASIALAFAPANAREKIFHDDDIFRSMRAQTSSPCQWNYTFVGGVATATYCGNVVWPGGVTGNGTSGYIPKWTGGTSLGNSAIQDQGGNIEIGESVLITGVFGVTYLQTATSNPLCYDSTATPPYLMLASCTFAANYPSYTCHNNSAIDDGPGLQTALATASGSYEPVVLLGGVCWLLSSFNIPAGGATGLTCPATGYYSYPPGATNCVIRAGANLSTMMTQASLANVIYNFNMEGVAFDGNKGSYTVITAMIKISTQGGYFGKNQVLNGYGDCWDEEASATTTWLNIWRDNAIGSCGGLGFLDAGSDDWFGGGELGGSYVGAEFEGSGPHQFVQNRVEVNTTNGVSVISPNTGCSNNTVSFTSMGNLYEQNNVGLSYSQGACSSGNVPTYATVAGRQSDLFIENTNWDVFVNPSLNYIALGPNSHQNGSINYPTDAYYAFNTGGSLANASIMAQVTNPSTTLVQNPPSGLVTHFCGATSSGC